ncbi:MAG TPA: universal stress protein [Jiangellales bacterium]|nr:universal stress protein [Jiangellales bacterium]
MPAVILVGVDQSDGSRRAVEFARDRAREVGAALLIAHVIPWSPYSFTTPEENETRHVRREAELAAAREQVLGPACALVGDGVECTSEARHGHPAETLSSLAREHDAMHVVVGRTGESRLRSMLFGSVPSQLIQIADVPVTVVP